MEIKTITLQPVSGNQNYVYNLGDVQAVISLGHRASVTNDYLLMIFNERLALMADARTRQFPVLIKQGITRVINVSLPVNIL